MTNTAHYHGLIGNDAEGTGIDAMDTSGSDILFPMWPQKIEGVVSEILFNDKLRLQRTARVKETENREDPGTRPFWSNTVSASIIQPETVRLEIGASLCSGYSRFWSESEKNRNDLVWVFFEVDFRHPKADFGIFDVNCLYKAMSWGQFNVTLSWILVSVLHKLCSILAISF